MIGTPPRLRGLCVDRLLGAGSTARVWQAVTRDGGRVALKHVHHPGAGALPEAEVLDGLDHPNLIRLREVRRWRGDPILVLDLASGGTLAQLLQRRRRLPCPEVIAALTPVASAVAAIHAAGLVHGDVTPGNILFTEHGLPLLSDLGSAYAADGVPTSSPAQGFADPVTEGGGIGGTAADVYGLAAVAFAALTGAAPSGSTCRTDALAASGAPPALVDLILSGLDPDPGCRGTALEFALQLRWSGPMSGVDVHAGRHANVEPLPVLTRGRRVETGPTGRVGRSRFPLPHPRRSERRDTRPSRRPR